MRSPSKPSRSVLDRRGVVEVAFLGGVLFVSIWLVRLLSAAPL
jgi:hypothetical protein